jgi:tRNA (guanine9-N1)-methyltransferase
MEKDTSEFIESRELGQEIQRAPLSKNAQKRALRQKKFAETRAEWKSQIKAKKKERKAQRQRLLEALPDVEKEQPKVKLVQEPPSGRIVIDLAFEHLMREKVASPTSFHYL